MYSKQEASVLKQEFWTILGKYLSPITSAEGEKINWINYKTGEKFIQFRMHADTKQAAIIIEINHPDLDKQRLYFDHFQSLNKIFFASLQEEWQWNLHGIDEYGKVTSSISRKLEPVNILNKEDWPVLISFFKSRIIALDEFWNNIKYGFEELH